MEYDFKKIEKKWQKRWEKEKLYEAKGPAAAKAKAGEEKFYCLIEFPYPSGEGLHVGHPRSYTALDIVARKKRMQGKNVLYPIGWDAYGLPTENYAIKTGIQPAVATEKNIKNFTRQLKSLGFSFDWSREINTTDPEYYKWTQWMFLQFFKHGLAYKDKIAINWCTKCKIGLANEEVVNGVCERCGGTVEKRMKEQWMIKITKYAERLLEGLKNVDYSPRIKEGQINWIGKSEGATVRFNVIPAKAGIQKTGSSGLVETGLGSGMTTLEVFTTRPDTLFGATYMVLAPEHEIIKNLKSKISNFDEVERYINEAKRKSDLERTELQKEKTGVELKGIKAINPANNEEISIWVADYVLTGYGTGAIMAVPAHDERDFQFAKKFGLPIREVVQKEKEGKIIIIHGSSGRNKTTDPNYIVPERRHWHGWLEDQLKAKEYKVENPRMPNDWAPVYKEWKDIIDKIGVNNNDTIVATSGGAPFILRYLSESGKKVKRLIFNVPAYYLGEGEERLEEFVKFKIDEPVKNITNDVTIFISNDHPHRIKSAKYLAKELKAKLVGLKDRGHFCIDDNPMNKEFPELLQEITGSNCFIGEGTAVNSGFIDRLPTAEAKEKITSWLEEKKIGKKSVNYKLRDWIFSRQRYWGEPIPLVHCENCGWQAVPEKDLPVELPKVKKYEPTETGESPLAAIEKWVKTKCPKCGGEARRETDTMPNWAGSSWYFMRYTDPKNKKEFASGKNLKYWMGPPARLKFSQSENLGGVDWYNGGMEHTTLHLLYSRFWYKFLYDIGAVPKECGDEPYKKRTSHGLILGEGGEKMSKSRGNVVNPDDIVARFGADTLRVYEMFMGPFEQAIPWDEKGVVGVFRFLERVWKLQSRIKSESKANQNELERLIYQTIKKVGEDIEAMKFNTAVSALMILTNAMSELENLPVTSYQVLITLLAPFAPHMAEELWKKLGHKKSIHLEKWPEYDPVLIVEEEIDLIVQINGKMRDSIRVKADISEEEAKKIAMESEKVKKWIEGQKIKKIIFVKGRLVNIVV